MTTLELILTLISWACCLYGLADSFIMYRSGKGKRYLYYGIVWAILLVWNFIMSVI